MKQNIYINVGPYVYPMRFSLGASKAIAEKFGSLKEMWEAMKDGASEGGTEAIIWILETLIRQGCAYKKLFEPNIPYPEGARYNETGYILPTEEEMLVGVDMNGDVVEKIMEVISGHSKAETKIKEKGQDDKIKKTETM